MFAPMPGDIELGALDLSRIPRHVAVIMDGNGRWAELHGKNRALGHKAGIKGVRALIRTANDIGVRYLTIYSFSTENWARPAAEVKTLMALFAKTLATELDGLHEEQVRITTIGDLAPLPKVTREVFEQAAERTKDNPGMTLIIAVNYGSQLEIVEAAKALAMQALRGEISAEQIEAISPADFAELLHTAGIPDPDLLIRTSGECRISNFLLFQIAYSEIYITPTLWPDFDKYEFLRAILAYQGRERRYGGV
jgi:undecaprenyl diphosphate synthase